MQIIYFNLQANCDATVISGTLFFLFNSTGILRPVLLCLAWATSCDLPGGAFSSVVWLVSPQLSMVGLDTLGLTILSLHSREILWGRNSVMLKWK